MGKEKRGKTDRAGPENGRWPCTVTSHFPRRIRLRDIPAVGPSFSSSSPRSAATTTTTTTTRLLLPSLLSPLSILLLLGQTSHVCSSPRSNNYNYSQPRAARLPPAPSPSPRPSSARAETCQGPRPRPHTLALPLPHPTTTTTTTLTTTTTTTTTGSSHAPSHVPPPRGGALSLRDGRRGQGARSCSRYAFLSLSLSLSFPLSLSLLLSLPDFGETVPSIDFIFPTCPNHIRLASPRLPSSSPLLLAGAQ